MEKVQVVFPSIPSMAGRDTEKNRKAYLTNIWLRGWCHGRNFGFFDPGEVFLVSGLMATDGSHLSQRGNRS